MTQAIMNQARQYPGQERQFFEFVQQNQPMKQQLRAPLFEDEGVDHIADAAKLTKKEISKDDLQIPDPSGPSISMAWLVPSQITTKLSIVPE